MSISNPKANIQIIPAYQTVQNDAQKILYIGQKTSAGTATSGTLEQSIGNANEQDTLFGADSILAGMVRTAKAYNKVNRMDAIVLDDDGSAVDATGIIAFTGTATEAGTLTVYIGSRLNYSFTLTVASGATAASLGAALETAVAASTNIPVTAVDTTGSVAITANNGGETGNDISLQVDGAVAGITVAVTLMASGATDPDLSTVFALVENIRYQTVVFPSSYLSQNELIAFLNDRFNPVDPVDKILDGVGIAAKTDTYANLVADTTLADNSQNFWLMPNRTAADADYTGSALFELDYVIASQFAAIRALRLTPDASLSQFVDATAGAKDAFGGMHISTLPYHNTPFENLPLIDTDKMWTDSERQGLKDAGWTVIGNNVANNTVILDSVITRYLTDSAGNPDLSFKYGNYVDQASTVREYFHNNLKDTFKDSRLTHGDLVPGYSMANEGVARGEVLKLYKDLADQAIVTSGENARKLFLQNLTITIDEIEGQVSITMLDPVVTQLRSIIATMQLTFSF